MARIFFCCALSLTKSSNMSLRELKSLINLAIVDFQEIIDVNPKAVLSEGDFERILANCISSRINYNPGEIRPKSYAVYTQISHYDNEDDVLNARVDIILMKPDRIKQYRGHHKGFFYKSKESLAIELKYRHEDNRSCVTAAKDDIDKFLKYKEDSYYYAIILLDENNNTSEHEKEILDYFKCEKKKLEKKYLNKFFCKVLKKRSFDSNNKL